MPHRNRAPVHIPDEDWREAWKLLREALQTGKLQASDAKRMARLLRWIDLVYQDEQHREILVLDRCVNESASNDTSNVVRFKR